jgi:hypothetical protein
MRSGPQATFGAPAAGQIIERQVVGSQIISAKPAGILAVR